MSPASETEKPTPSATRVEPKATQASAAAAPEVKLLDAGSEPRRALRHTFAKGKLKLELEAATKVSGPGGMALPSMTLRGPIEAEVVDVKKAGDARFKFSAGPLVSGSKAPGGEGAGLGELLGLSGASSAPKQIKGQALVSPRGVVSEFHLDEGGGVGDSPVESGDPFPEEAVGVGARWEVTSVVRERDGLMHQTSSYELVRLDKKQVTTKLSRTQTPLNADETTASAASTGELTFRFGDVFPTGHLSMTRDMSSEVPGLGAVSIHMVSEVTMTRR